jgi:hypothetical protein
MGWLFGDNKKVVPKVPFPMGKSLDDKSLRFSAPKSTEREIQPDRVQEAVGYSQPMSFQTAFGQEQAPLPRNVLQKNVSKQEEVLPQPVEEVQATGPMFVKVDVYQLILDEVDGLKGVLGDLQEANRLLEKSEYNEEHNFEKLRKTMRGVHDRFLQVDKKLFKLQGD